MARIPADPAEITAGWLSDVMCADVASCHVEQIAIGVGLLGRLFRVTLQGRDLPPSVVVKLPTLDVRARTNLCENLNFYLREVHFYQEIGLANPLPPARPLHAAFDDSTHDFVLVLEDLGALRNADQTIGCDATDAGTVMDALARHQAYWWNNDRLASLPWLSTYNTPPFPTSTIANVQHSWPRFLEHFGDRMSPAMRHFGDRLPSLIPWYFAELARPPHTFLHGDLRLDQLFFAMTSADAAVTALDWQLTAKGRGAYDVAYFLSQSLATDTRRSHEGQLLERYAERLRDFGIGYPHEELQRDYRLATAICFVYPVIATGRIDIANERQLELLRAMADRSVLAIEDNDALALRPD